MRCHATGVTQSAGLECDHQHGRHDGEGAEGDKRPDERSAVIGVEERAASERADQPAHDGQSTAQHHSASHAGAAEDESAEGAGRGTRQSEDNGDSRGWGGGNIVGDICLYIDINSNPSCIHLYLFLLSVSRWRPIS